MNADTLRQFEPLRAAWHLAMAAYVAHQEKRVSAADMEEHENTRQELFAAERAACRALDAALSEFCGRPLWSLNKLALEAVVSWARDGLEY